MVSEIVFTIGSPPKIALYEPHTADSVLETCSR